MGLRPLFRLKSLVADTRLTSQPRNEFLLLGIIYEEAETGNGIDDANCGAWGRVQCVTVCSCS